MPAAFRYSNPPVIHWGAGSRGELAGELARLKATRLALVTTRSLQANAQDDVLDVLDRLLTDLLARVDRQERHRRLRTIGDLDVAALPLREIGLVVLDQATSAHTMRSEIFARWPRERIEQVSKVNWFVHQVESRIDGTLARVVDSPVFPLWSQTEWMSG